MFVGIRKLLAHWDSGYISAAYLEFCLIKHEEMNLEQEKRKSV